jgi:hypothetical protein
VQRFDRLQAFPNVKTFQSLKDFLQDLTRCICRIDRTIFFVHLPSLLEKFEPDNFVWLNASI